MFDAMLTLACEEALDREYAEAKAYAEANPVIPSEAFHKRMEKLIRGGTGKPAKAKKPQGRRVLRVCKRTAVIIMILCTISFITLMCSAAVRVEVHRMHTEMRASIRALFERFESEHPGETATNDDLIELSTNMQIEAVENALAITLLENSISSDVRFQIYIDGYLNVSILLPMILAIQDDDERHFVEHIYENYKHSMFRVARAVLKDDTKAEGAG